MKRDLFIYTLLGLTAFIASIPLTVYTQKVTEQDRSFLRVAAQDAVVEMNLASIALERARHDATKQFAREMIRDHAEANGQVRGLLTKYDRLLPQDLNPDTSGEVLGRLDAEPDTEYLRLSEEHHQKVVSIFERQAREGATPELRAWAKKMLPIVRSHAERAHLLRQQ